MATSEVPVAEQRERQLERIRERLLSEGVVGADPKDLDTQFVELAVVGLPGREVVRSDRGKLAAVELDENELLPLKLAQADLLAGRAREREVRRRLPDLQRRRHAGYTQYADQQHTGQRTDLSSFALRQDSSYTSSFSPAQHRSRMTRSARYNTSGAIVSFRALATFRLIANSIFGFASTGISAGSSPLRILSTRRAAWRPDSYKSGP